MKCWLCGGPTPRNCEERRLRLTLYPESDNILVMDEIEGIFEKLRQQMRGRVSESILIELDVVEIRMQQLLLREVAKERFVRPNAPAAPGVN